MAAILSGCARGDAAAAQALRSWEKGRVAQQLSRTFDDAGAGPGRGRSAPRRPRKRVWRLRRRRRGGGAGLAVRAHATYSPPSAQRSASGTEAVRGGYPRAAIENSPLVAHRATESVARPDRRRAGSHERATAAPHGRGSWPRYPCRGEGQPSSTPLWPARHNRCLLLALPIGSALVALGVLWLSSDRPALEIDQPTATVTAPPPARSAPPSRHRARAHAARATRAADRHAGAAGGRSTDEASFSSASTRRDGTDPAATYRGAPQWEPGERVRSRSARFAAPLGGLRAVEVRAVPFDIGTASVRFFFDQDRSQAERLTAAIGPFLSWHGRARPSTPIGFTDYRPLPRQGTLEIWLPRR